MTCRAPHPISRPSADSATTELLHRLVEGDPLLAEQDALLHQRIDDLEDAGDVARAGPPHAELAHVATLPRPPSVLFEGGEGAV